MFPIKKLTLAFLLFFAVALYITHPLILNLSSLTTGFGDEYLIAWIQSFVVNNLTNPIDFFNSNIFYPYKNSLAYSDLFITSSLISFIPLWLYEEPITAVNFTLFSSLIMLGFSTFFLSYYITRNFLASLISGLLIMFSPATLDKKVHLQILSIFWIPFSITFFFHFLKTRESKFFALSMIFFVLQTLNSFLPGYFLIFFFSIVTILYFLFERKVLKELLNKNNFLILIIGFAVLIPFVVPYLNVSREFSYKRDIRDSIHFALQPEDLLVTSEHSRMQEPLSYIFENKNYPPNAEIKPGFLGLVFSLMAIFLIVYFVKNFKKKDIVFNSLFMTGIVGLITSLGPALHLNRLTVHEPFPIVLPYTLFYYLLPGFNGFRNSARWEMLLVLCFAVAIAILIERVLRNKSGKVKLAVGLSITFLIIIEFRYPLKFYAVEKTNNFPKVYEFLKDKNETSIFIPICNWNYNCGHEELRRVYFSTLGFPRTVNGASGFSPPPWEKRTNQIMTDFPSQKTLELIKNQNVRYLVFEKDKYEIYFSKHNGNPSEQVLTGLMRSKELELIGQFDNTYVFEL